MTTTKPQSTELPPEDMTDDELKSAINFHEREAAKLKNEGAKMWRLRLRIGNGEPVDRQMLADLHNRRAARISPASAAPVVDEEALKKRARQIIDAVIESPVIVEVRTFSQPEEVDKLEDRVAALLQKSIPAAATAAPQTKSCGFCGKSDQEVKALIQAPVGYICDECVAVCASIIERNRTAAPVEQSDEYHEGFDDAARVARTLNNVAANCSSTSARAAAEEIREWIGISGLVDGKGIDEVAAIIERHYYRK